MTKFSQDEYLKILEITIYNFYVKIELFKYNLVALDNNYINKYLCNAYKKKNQQVTVVFGSQHLLKILKSTSFGGESFRRFSTFKQKNYKIFKTI